MKYVPVHQVADYLALGWTISLDRHRFGYHGQQRVLMLWLCDCRMVCPVL